MGEPKVLLLGTQKKENEYAFSDQSIGYAVDEFFLHKYGVSYYTYNKSMLEEVTELEVLKAENLSELSKMPYITKLTLKGGHDGYLELNKLNTLSVKGGVLPSDAGYQAVP